MRATRRGALALLAAAWLATAVGAQTPAPPPVPVPTGSEGLDVRIEKIDITHFPLVTTFLTVVDPLGKAINAFERRSFQVSEQGTRCRLDTFRIDRTPLAVSLLLDTSGSMEPALLDAKRAAAHFIRVLEPHDQALMMVFSDLPRILVPFTYDQDRLVVALGPVGAYGPTALYDAIHQGVLELASVPGRRVMLLLTDGQDQNAPGTARQSRHTLDEALELAVKQQVVVHVVALGKYVNVPELTRVAQVTHGELYRTGRSQDLESLYMLISRNLKSRVELSYRAPDARVDGSWRVQEVRVSAGGMLGSAQAAYRAPGRYVVEVPGQGYDRLRIGELGREVPPVRLRDLNLRPVLQGGKKELGDWIDGYFKRPSPP